MGFLAIFGDYRFISSCSFLTAVACFILGLLILSANFYSLSCRLVALYNFSIALWAILYAVTIISGVSSVGLSAAKIMTSCTFLISVTFIHLVLLIRKMNKSYAIYIAVNYGFSIVAILLTLTTPLIVNSVSPKLGFPAYINNENLYFLSPGYMLVSVICAAAFLIQGIRVTMGDERKQLFTLLLATIIGFSTGMLSYLLVFDIPLKPILNPLVILNPLLVAYAIVKHRFLDIRKLARNTLVFSLLFVCLLVVVAGLLFIFQRALSEKLGFSATVSQLMAIIIALMIYTPLKRSLSAATRKLLHQHTQDAASIFRRLSEDLFKFLEVKKLAEEMTMRVTTCLLLEQIAFYRRESAKKDFDLHGFVGSRKVADFISDKAPLIQYLEYSKSPLLNPYGLTDRVVNNDRNESPANRMHFYEDSLNAMIQGEWAVALPIFNKDQLAGLILMGHKKSDAPWTQEELGVLESFAHCFSLALINADAAESIRILQRKILASERDASAGALIAGVDHEAKNPLHAACLALSTLDGFLTHPKFLSQPRNEQEACVKETMQSVLEDIEEVNHVIQHLSNLAEQKPLRIREGVVLADVCRKAFKTSGSADKIQMNFDFQELFFLTCDAEALQEILSNLIRNAAQAGARELWVKAYYQQNSSVVLEVKDSGHGIPDVIAQRIFDPFFTTKERGASSGSSGTGMGLFIVRESMRAMGGDIQLVSRAKQGTVFKLLFRGYPSLKTGALYEP